MAEFCGKSCIFFCKHVYLDIDPALCPRMLSKFSMVMSTHIWSLATARTEVPYSRQHMIISGFQTKTKCHTSDCLLIKAMHSSLMHSATALMLLSTLCTGVGMDHLKNSSKAQRASIWLQTPHSQYMIPVGLHLRCPFSVLTNTVRNFNLDSSPPFCIVQN